MTKFSLPHPPAPESLACEGPKYERYYQCLMYDGLCTLDTVHKKICNMGPGLCIMLEVNFRECPKGEVRRILIPRNRVNRLWALLRASPLHGVDHLLRLGRKLFELGSRTKEANPNRLTPYVLQDDDAHLVSFKVPNWSASA
jgi:hypothetical protein